MAFWNGTISTDFLDAENWSTFAVPDANELVELDSFGEPNDPTLFAGQFASILALVQGTRVFTVQGTLTVGDGATLFDTGTLTIANGGTVGVGGSGLSVTGGTLNNFGTLNSTVQITHGGVVTNGGAINGAVTVLDGTLQVQGNITVAEAITLNGTGVGGGGALRNLTNTNDVTGLVTLTGTTRINSDSGQLTFTAAGGITGTNRNLTIGGEGTIFVEGNITTGTGTLTKDGTGFVALTGTNTFSGATTVNDGVLQVSNGSALSDTAALTVNGPGSAEFFTSETIGGLVGDGDVTLVTGGTQLTISTPGGSRTYSGEISESVPGGGSLVKTGVGVQVLSGANTYTGTTTVNGGILEVTGGSAIADTGNVIVGNGGTFTVSAVESIGNLSSSDTTTSTAVVNVNASLGIVGTADTFFDGNIAGAAQLTYQGTGSLTLTGANVFTGNLFSSGIGGGNDGTDDGAINITGDGTVATQNIFAVHGGTITTDGGAFVSNANLIVDGANSEAVLSGSETIGALLGNFGAAMTGTLTLTGVGTVLTLNGSTFNSQIGALVTGTGRLNVTGGTTTVGGTIQTLTTIGVFGTVENAGIMAGVTIAGTFANFSTVAGNVTVTGGTAQFNAGSNIADTAIVSVTGGSASFEDDDTIASLTQTGGTVNGTAQLTAGSFTQSGGTMAGLLAATTSAALNGGTISGTLSGGLATAASGTTNVTGSLITSGLTVSGGTLNLTGTGSVNTTGNTIAVSAGALVNDGNGIADSGAVSVSGTGTLTTNGTDTIASLTQTGGTVNGTAQLTAGSFTQSGGTMAGLLAATTSAALNGGTISGTLSGGLATAASGTTNVTGSLITSGLTVSGGTLNLTGTGSVDTTGNTITVNAGTLTDDGNGIADTDQLSVNGSGVFNLTGDDTIAGLEGSGSVNMGGKALTIAAQAVAFGTMIFNGGAGADTLTVTLAASSLDFSLAGATFNSWTAGTDTITINGNALDNVIVGNAAVNTLRGGGGNDTIRGGAGGDTLIGGANLAGGDTLSYELSSKGVNINLHLGTATGGHAAGDIFSDFENVKGSSRNDVIAGNAAANVLDGSAGSGDTLNYADSNAGVTVDLATSTASGGHATGDTISNFERVTGSAFADILMGSALNNRMSGGTGADIIFGSLGKDQLRGGSDFDTLDYGNSAQGVTINLALETTSGGDATGDRISSFEGVNGSASNDVLIGSDVANVLLGRGGDDLVQGGRGGDQMNGGQGAADTLSYASSSAAVIVDIGSNTASGGDADGDTILGFEFLTGSAFGDTLTGSSTSNTIMGGLGKDTIDGGGGSDTIIGGRNQDIISGGLGNDIYLYEDSREGGDTISSFGNAAGDNDLFALKGSAFGGLAAGSLLNSQFQNNGTSAAGNADVRFIYNSNTRELFFDSDGNGGTAAILLATLQPGATMGLNDLSII